MFLIHFCYLDHLYFPPWKLYSYSARLLASEYIEYRIKYTMFSMIYTQANTIIAVAITAAHTYTEKIMMTYSCNLLPKFFPSHLHLHTHTSANTTQQLNNQITLLFTSYFFSAISFLEEVNNNIFS